MVDIDIYNYMDVSYRDLRISYFGHACPKYEIGNFFFISCLTGKCSTQKFKNFCSSSPWTSLHHYDHIKKPKNTDFLTILARLCRFKMYVI